MHNNTTGFLAPLSLIPNRAICVNIMVYSKYATRFFILATHTHTSSEQLCVIVSFLSAGHLLALTRSLRGLADHTAVAHTVAT